MQFKLNQTFTVWISLPFRIFKQFCHILYVEQSFNFKKKHESNFILLQLQIHKNTINFLIHK